jgi:hypothetical protein
VSKDVAAQIDDFERAAIAMQRYMLGLDEKYGMPNNALNQTRWQAMSKETIRTANI